MERQPHKSGARLPAEEAVEILAALRARTPARVLTGRAGAAYRTSTQLALRCDHAAARDAVQAELDLDRDLGCELIARFALFEVCTRAASKAEYLRQPELGRSLSDAGAALITERCGRGADLQVVIGDGLSVEAVRVQVPALLPLLAHSARERNWRLGQPFVVRHCRVGLLNEIGAALDPAVVVLLIGERPGLATAESLSAYMAFRPKPGHTDAERNLISNIHARGVSPSEAAVRIMNVAAQMMRMQSSGVGVKEELVANIPRELLE